MSLNAVPNEEEPEQLKIDEFEGLIVSRYRLNPGSVGEFACLDEDNQPLKLVDGDIVVVQMEALITGVEFGAGYKGGIQIQSRDRVHKGHVLEGSQSVVGVRRRA